MTLKPIFSLLQEVSESSLTMKKEWSDTDEKTVNRAIKKLFSMQTLTDHRGQKQTMYTMANIEDFFGLPYTSSSSFAMISNTNTEYYIDTDNQYNIEFFALTEDNRVILSAWDKEENEKYFIIG
jgi:hypothetical protein